MINYTLYLIIALISILPQKSIVETNAKIQIIDFQFEKKFHALKINNQLKIKEARMVDWYQWIILDSIPDFYKGKIGFRGYFLIDNIKTNNIGITEYVYKDTIAANNAYTIAFMYAERVRKTPRTTYGYLGNPRVYPNFIYASRIGAHVYLYSISYNFLIHHFGNGSIETILQNNKQILIGELYGEMNNSIIFNN